jgi:hypothetical protein
MDKTKNLLEKIEQTLVNDYAMSREVIKSSYIINSVKTWEKADLTEELDVISFTPTSLVDVAIYVPKNHSAVLLWSEERETIYEDESSENLCKLSSSIEDDEDFWEFPDNTTKLFGNECTISIKFKNNEADDDDVRRACLCLYEFLTNRDKNLYETEIWKAIGNREDTILPSEIFKGYGEDYDNGALYQSTNGTVLIFNKDWRPLREFPEAIQKKIRDFILKKRYVKV